MGVTDMALTSPYIPFFMQAMVMASGSWPLQSCHLDGPFESEVVVGLLPQTLRHLVLKPDPATIGSKNFPYNGHSLHMFHRLSHLEHLQIDLGVPGGTADSSKLQGLLFEEDMCLPSLKSLYLSPQPLLCAPDLDLDQCLPCLEYLVVVTEYSCAQAILQMPKLKFLNLSLFVKVLHYGAKVLHHHLLTIPASSDLQRIHVAGPSSKHLELSLHIYKARLEVSCRNIDNIRHYLCEDFRSDCPFGTDLSCGQRRIPYADSLTIT